MCFPPSGKKPDTMDMDNQCKKVNGICNIVQIWYYSHIITVHSSCQRDLCYWEGEVK